MRNQVRACLLLLSYSYLSGKLWIHSSLRSQRDYCSSPTQKFTPSNKELTAEGKEQTWKNSGLNRCSRTRKKGKSPSFTGVPGWKWVAVAAARQVAEIWVLQLLIVFSGILLFLCSEALGFRVLLLEPPGSLAAQARWSRPVPCSDDPMRSRGSLLPHANLQSCTLDSQIWWPSPRSGLHLFILVLQGT
ncbi:hypothetical protein SLEP1_g27659 [Rubroshorea leprosula]|uniref:Uncharacterized protein n=1 Tax=Rubroshorea leprosula TaxID=152421 RepID=A0AAV5JXL3_9ROSI|nr:hypothetical protein SLEP1_g27659 [Rubroshorea leprosula]